VVERSLEEVVGVAERNELALRRQRESRPRDLLTVPNVTPLGRTVRLSTSIALFEIDNEALLVSSFLGRDSALEEEGLVEPRCSPFRSLQLRQTRDSFGVAGCSGVEADNQPESEQRGTQ
jgi:hypothetical protein